MLTLNSQINNPGNTIGNINLDGAVNETKQGVSYLINNDFLNSINFKFAKSRLIELISKGKLNGISQILMEMLTTRPEFLIERESSNDPDFLINLRKTVKKQSNYYKSVLEKVSSVSEEEGILEIVDNPAWFSLKTKINGNNITGLNYKIYLTIPIKGYEYVSKIYQLAKRINELANETNDKISLKVPNSMLGFLSHSDSLVIHFKNKDNKERIEMILEEWKNSNLIKEQKRNLGRTKFAVDSNDSSFSQLVSNNIEKWFLEHYGKYENEVLIDLTLKYAIEQSQKLPKIG
ncbi:hypothetical protein EOM39_04220 [Candidatus Gracilibacteria bacterium]|nr:hypothetical protein [Candidatus Gracilibacteria bacterium]